MCRLKISFLSFRFRFRFRWNCLHSNICHADESLVAYLEFPVPAAIARAELGEPKAPSASKQRRAQQIKTNRK